MLICDEPLILVWHVYTVSAISVLASSLFWAHELTVYHCSMLFVVVVFAATVFLFCRENAPKGLFSITWTRPVPLEDFCTMMKNFCTTCETFYATVRMTSHWIFLGTKKRTVAEQTVVCLDEKGLWKPGQRFILTGFTLSLQCSAPCGTGKTTIDTGCDPALLHNWVEFIGTKWLRCRMQISEERAS